MKPAKSSRNRYWGAAFRLLYNALKFRFLRRINRPLKPTVLSLALTSRCNSHCIMCNIWQSTKETPDIQSLELSKQTIIELLSSPLFSELVELDLTGGEPHLRDDLVDIVLDIIKLKNTSLTRLRSIIITSNGFLTEKITANYRDILKALAGTDVDLVSVISIDGMEDTHDRIRGTKHAFKMATETLRGLAELRREYPNLIPGIKTTILPQNIDSLNNILNLAKANDCFHIISPAFLTETRFKNTDKRDEITLAPAEWKKVLDFYNHDELKTGYFYTKARDFLSTGGRGWVCTALGNYLFIDFDGKIYPCELIPEPVGDLKQQNIKDIWESPRARIWRRRTGKTEHCRTCHEPGAMRYSAFAEGLSYLGFLSKLGENYSESLDGEGYSKYL